MAERAPRFAVTRARSTGDITAPLLAYLRDRFDAPALAFETAPAPILGGFDTSIYGFAVRGGGRLDGPCVARIFRSPEDAPRARQEATVQDAIASLGYPAPEILAFEHSPELFGAPFTVMRRMRGQAMLGQLLGPRMGAMAALLGRAHARLHALDVAAFRSAAGAALDEERIAGVDVFLQQHAEVIARASLDGLRPALRWLEEQRPPTGPDVICHGDFHPLNVLVERGHVTGVVDWAWVGIAPAEFDIGATVALLSHGPISLPRVAMPLVRALRRWVTVRYLHGYASVRPHDATAVPYYEALRLTGFLVEAAEQMQAALGHIESTMDSPFFARSVREGALRRLREVVGARVTLPGERGA